MSLAPAEPKEGEDADPDNPVLVIDKRKIPEFVVKFESTDDFLKGRVKALPEEKVAGTHYNEEGMTRRLAAFNKVNVSEGGSSVLSTFFDEHEIEILRLKVEGMSEADIFNAIKIFVERVD